jgi:hypothetical protein
MTARQQLLIRNARRVRWVGRLLLLVVLVAMVPFAESWPWVFAAAAVGVLMGAWEQAILDHINDILTGRAR